MQEIRRVTEITTRAARPEFIRGVINLRGRILPVVDLQAEARLSAMREVQLSRAHRGGAPRAERLLGLLVDGASQGH